MDFGSTEFRTSENQTRERRARGAQAQRLPEGPALFSAREVAVINFCPKSGCPFFVPRKPFISLFPIKSN
jgi:hypothetical protein